MKPKQIVWPSRTLFTIRQLHSLNPGFKEITLRVRLTKEIEAGTMAEIASLTGGRGRLEKVFTLTPVTEEKIQQALNQRMNLADEFWPMTEILTLTE